MKTRTKFSIFLLIFCILAFYIIIVLSKQASGGYTYLKAQLPASLEKKEARLSQYLRSDDIVRKHKTLKLKVPVTGAYLGVDTDLRKNGLKSFEGLIGKRVSIVNYYVYWGAPNKYFDADFASRHWVEDKVLLITWNPSQSLSSHPINQPKYRLNKIIKGDFDEYIDRWATDIKKWNRPIIIRFAPEMNGYWLPWGTRFATPVEYKKSYKYVYDKFKARGVKNASWMWSPNEAEKIAVMNYYPGDAYVDWIGFSGFNWGKVGPGNSWRSIPQIYSKSLAEVSGLKKPIAFVEMGSVEDTKDVNAKAKWIIDSFATIRQRYKEVKMLIWYNGKSFGRYDWRITTSKQALKAYRKAVSEKYFISEAQVADL